MAKNLQNNTGCHLVFPWCCLVWCVLQLSWYVSLFSNDWKWHIDIPQWSRSIFPVTLCSTISANRQTQGTAKHQSIAFCK